MYWDNRVSVYFLPNVWTDEEIMKDWLNTDWLNADWLNADWLNADWLNADWLNADWLNADWLNADWLNTDWLNTDWKNTLPIHASFGMPLLVGRHRVVKTTLARYHYRRLEYTPSKNWAHYRESTV